jgi:endonuclease YncB( thermonuclease family)
VVAVVVLVGLVAVLSRTVSDSGSDRGGDSGGDRGVARRVAVVSHVIDGDTVEIRSGEHVRLIGIDTPERDACGYVRAAQALRRLVEGKEVELVDPDSVVDQDRYDRLLRYVDVGGRDAGYLQVSTGLARARYDSLDGYDPHPRQKRYRAADRAAPDVC